MPDLSVRDRQDLRLLRRHRAGDVSARRELVRRYTPLVRSVARAQAQDEDALEGLVRTGLEILDAAIDGYDVHRPRRFAPELRASLAASLAQHGPLSARVALEPRTLVSRRPRPFVPAGAGFRVRLDEPLSALDDRHRTVVPTRHGSPASRTRSVA